ncbi:PIN-like domain-containing protein [Latilactobacillus sakei]|uniref:PIN-like domain-containing protein n=1 Tax=Latilactobacillus sakei TaxID=1599 RepID=UPI00388565FD
MPSNFDSLFSNESEPTTEKMESSDSLFVFDTNALLSIYRDSPEQIANLISFIKKYKKNIFIPYIVGVEFGANYHSVKASLHEGTKETIKNLSKNWNDILSSNKISNILPKELVNTGTKKIKNANSFLGAVVTSENELIEIVSEAFTKVLTEESMAEKINENIKFIRDKLTESLTEREVSFEEFISLIKPCIGNEPSQDWIDTVEKEGEYRYTHKIAPGFNDSDKNDKRIFGITYHTKYGDLLIWKEILQFYENKSDYNRIIFISDDGRSRKKNDFLDKTEPNNFLPRMDLKGELNSIRASELYVVELDSILQISSTDADEIEDEIENNEAYRSTFSNISINMSKSQKRLEIIEKMNKSMIYSKIKSNQQTNSNQSLEVNTEDDLINLIEINENVHEWILNELQHYLESNYFDGEEITGGTGQNPSFSEIYVNIDDSDYQFNHLGISCTIKINVDFDIITNDPHNDNEEISESISRDFVLTGDLEITLPQYAIIDGGFSIDYHS